MWGESKTEIVFFLHFFSEHDYIKINDRTVTYEHISTQKPDQMFYDF